MNKRNRKVSWAPNEVPHSHFLILWSIVWTYHQQTGHDPEDLFGEASLKYCLCRDRWNRKRGEFSTYLYTVIPNHLKDYLWKNWDIGKRIKLPDGTNTPLQFIPLEHVEQLLLKLEEERANRECQIFSV